MAPYHPDPPHIDFLATEFWIDSGLQDPDCINIDENRFTLSNFPGCSWRMRFCYTFHTTSQSIVNESVQNHLVDRFSRGSAIWKGDVLVVKSRHDSPELVVNMEQTDVELVNLLLWR